MEEGKRTNGNYITLTFHYPPWCHTEYQQWQTKVSSVVCDVLLHVCRNDAWIFMNERRSVFIRQDTFFQTLRAQKAAFQERLLLVCSQERKVIVQRLQWSYSTKAGLWKNKTHTHTRYCYAAEYCIKGEPVLTDRSSLAGEKVNQS